MASFTRKVNTNPSLGILGDIYNANDINELQLPIERLTTAIRDVREFGVTGDGVTDDSLAGQAAIDDLSADGGGALLFPTGTYRGNFVLKNGVYLVGTTPGFGYLPGAINQTKFVGAVAGAVIDTPVASTACCGVVGINVQGLGASTAMKGIRFRDVNWGVIKDVHLNNFADEGLLIESGWSVVDHVLAINCLLDRSRSAVAGAVDIAGTDTWASRIEASISGSAEGTVQSGSLFCAAIAWRVSNGVADGLIGELSDIGIYVSGDYSGFVNCRADLNYGHGWYVTSDAGQNEFANCKGVNNSQDTTNTYDHFYAENGSSNVFTNCVCGDALTKKTRYSFNDQVSSAANKNRYVNCTPGSSVTGDFNQQIVHGSAFVFASGSAKTLTANSATPSVAGYERFATGNTVATTITNFTGGVAGQRILVQVTDANTTIQHNGATISTLNAGNVKLRSGKVYEFVRMGGVWLEVNADIPLGVTADVGDAAKSLQARVNEETQIWNTPLTADRAVTLSTTGPYAGAKFRIVRTANATGAFNLNVGTGPLKALAAGQWADVEYSGSAWVLTASGAL